MKPLPPSLSKLSYSRDSPGYNQVLGLWGRVREALGSGDSGVFGLHFSTLTFWVRSLIRHRWKGALPLVLAGIELDLGQVAVQGEVDKGAREAAD